MQTLVMTGAAGQVATLIRPLLGALGIQCLLSDRKALADLSPGERFQYADLGVLSDVESLVSGVDGVIHLGGLSRESHFEALLDANIRGTYHLYEACRRQGVKRVFLASSNHVTGFYPVTQPLDAYALPRPDTLYGVSKGVGELLARCFYDRFGIESACVRIGSCCEAPTDKRMLSTWLSPNDLARLIQQVFTVEHLGCPVIYGCSNNSAAWWKNASDTGLGWHPQDSADEFKSQLDDDVTLSRQGGSFVDLPFGEPEP